MGHCYGKNKMAPSPKWLQWATGHEKPWWVRQVGTPCRESGYLFSGLCRGKGKVRKEGRRKSKRQREGGRGALGRRERSRSCLFRREMERKELRLEAEGRSACLSRWGREWMGLVS